MPSVPVTTVLVLASLSAASTACGHSADATRAARSPESAESVLGDAAPAGADASGLLKGTPAGGLRDWIADVGTGLRHDVEPLVETSSSKALEHAVALYVTRQEYIEQYYEKGRPLYAGEALATAVKDAETRFHELMEVLQRQPADAPAVDEAVDRLMAQYGRVLSEAEAANARMSPRKARSKAEHRS